MLEDAPQSHAGKRPTQPCEVQPVGEDHGDDDDGSKVIGDGQSEQKGPDRLWHSRSDDGQDG